MKTWLNDFMKNPEHSGFRISGANIGPLKSYIRKLLLNDYAGGLQLAAKLTGTSYQTFYSALTDQTNSVPLDLLRVTQSITQDPIISMLLSWIDMRISPMEGSGEQLGGLEKEMSDIHLAAGRAHQAAREALQDGHISESEDAEIRRLANHAQAEIIDTLKLLDEIRARGGRVSTN